MRENPFDGVTGSKPVVKRLVVDSEFSRPVCQGHAPSLMLKEYGSATVVHLVYARSPATIFRRIWAIVVDSVQFMTRGARPHVREESGKVISPSAIHDNTAPAISGKLVTTGGVAATLSAGPSLVFSGSMPISNSRSMFSGKASRFKSQASTASGYVHQIPGNYIGLLSTNALAAPSCMPIFGLRGLSNYRKPSEDFSFELVFDWAASGLFHSPIVARYS